MSDDGAVDRLTPWIGGQSQAHDGNWIESLNPSDARTAVLVAESDFGALDSAVLAAQSAQVSWAKTSTVERADILADIASAISANSEDLANADARETGKARHVALEEMAGAARYFSYYAAEVRTLSGETIEQSPLEHAFVQRVPFGVVGVVLPWNYSANQASRSVAPALAMGNAVVVKPSEHATGSVLALARLAVAAGLPAGLFNVVPGSGATVGQALVEHQGVNKISFTGSVATGRRIAELAASRLVPVSLELGGKSPHLVFSDANLERAADVIVAGFTSFAGQTCSAGTRVLVASSVADQLNDLLISCVERLDLVSDVGPVISQTQLDAVEQAVAEAIDAGATCAVGGRVAGDAGFYYQPTVLTDVEPEMSVFHREVFGPVLTVTTFTDESEAVELANLPDFGLVAGVWTTDLTRALRVSGQLQCGQVFVNRWGASERVPFGGFGMSGLGREKGRVALDEYSHTRAVVIDVR